MATGDTSPALTREQGLDELDLLARIEHSLCVEYLSVSYALGRGAPPLAAEDVGERVQQASDRAFGLAKHEMRHMHSINQLLAAAGRLTQLGRAASIQGGSGAEISLTPPSAAELEHLLDREREIATAVDARHAQLTAALEAEPHAFDDELLGRITSFLGLDHLDFLSEIEEELQRAPAIPPTVYLRATRRDPANELERSLLELSDRLYGVVLATVRVWFAHDNQPGDDELPGKTEALSAMDALDASAGLLVRHGLLPAFTLPH